MPFLVSGVIEILKNDGKVTLDYGKGDYDDFTTITVKGVAKEIHLKK